MKHVEDPPRSLMLAMLEQAVLDYITLRELGAVKGEEIAESRWRHVVNETWRYRPIGYKSVAEVRELIEFLKGDDFAAYCDFVSTEKVRWQACRIRKRLGLVPGDARPMIPTDVWWISTPRNVLEKMHEARDGTSLAPLPIYNAGANVADTDDESDLQAA